MKRTQQLFDKIEAYLARTLPLEEREAFEKEMDENPELQLEVEKHRELHAVFADEDTMAFKQQLIEISRSIREEEAAAASTFKTTSRFLKIAASIALIIGIGSAIWYTYTIQDQNNDLYAAYYSRYPVEDVTRGDKDNVLKNILKDYASGAYKNVIDSLENSNLKESNQRLKIYLGNSYLQTENPKDAITQFASITPSSRYYEIAQWYLSLAHLKKNQPKQSIKTLKNIIEFNGSYKRKAERLLKELSE